MLIKLLLSLLLFTGSIHQVYASFAQGSNGNCSTVDTHINPSDKGVNFLLKGNCLTANNTAASNQIARGTTSKSSGKWHLEFKIIEKAQLQVGVANSTASLSNYCGVDANSACFDINGGYILFNGVTSGSSITANNGSLVMIEIDKTAGTFAVSVDGAAYVTCPATCLPTGAVFPVIKSIFGAGLSSKATLNACRYGCGLPRSGYSTWDTTILPIADYPAQHIGSPSSLWNTAINSGTATYSTIVKTGCAVRSGQTGGNWPTGCGTLYISTYSAETFSFPWYVATTQNSVLMPVLYNSNNYTNLANSTWLQKGNSPAVEATILAGSSSVFSSCNDYSSINSTHLCPSVSYNHAVDNGVNNSTGYYYSLAMNPEGRPESHLSVLQPSGKIIETFSTIFLSTGQVVAGSASLVDRTGLFDGFQDGATASMVPVIAGVLDDYEILSGVINHAIAGEINPELLVASSSLPAYAWDSASATSGPAPYSGPLSMGARLAIPWSVTLSGLGLTTPEGLILATALQKYGLIIVDRGNVGLGLRDQNNPTVVDPPFHTPSTSINADLALILPQLQLVTHL